MSWTVAAPAVFANHPLVAGAVLLLGCLGTLVANVARAARDPRST